MLAWISVILEERQDPRASDRAYWHCIEKQFGRKYFKYKLADSLYN